MKKLLTVLLTALMVFAATVSIAAEEIGNGPNPSSTVLTYTVGEKYTWTIPSATDISTTEGALTNKVTIYGLLADGKKVEIKVSSANGWKVQLGADNDAVDYTLKADTTTLTNGSVVATLNSGSNTTDTDKLEVELKAQVTGTATKAGAHTDTLTFTASYS